MKKNHYHFKGYKVENFFWILVSDLAAMKRARDTVEEEGSLVVDFACFVTCLWNESIKMTLPASVILGMQIPGCELNCMSVAVSKNQAIEIYMECDGLPVTRLLFALEEAGMCCVSIFTFGRNPKFNGAPEAIARIRFRVERCNFVGYYKGSPSVGPSLDFDIRDKCPNWARTTVDQLGLMLVTSPCKPSEVVEWCVAAFSGGDTAVLERRLRTLRIRSGACRQYYIKGFECMRTPTSARVYLEMEPIAKTVLLRCLREELALSVEIVTFAPNQQAVALAWVSELGGVLMEHGNLSEVPAVGLGAPSFLVTRFTEQDLNIWDCVVKEASPVHWAVLERDTEMACLRSEMAALQMENSLLRDESGRIAQESRRFVGAIEELKADRDRLRKEVDGGDGLVGWSEWELMRDAVEERDRCISQLKARLQRGGAEKSDDFFGWD